MLEIELLAAGPAAAGVGHLYPMIPCITPSIYALTMCVDAAVKGTAGSYSGYKSSTDSFIARGELHSLIE